MLNLVKNSIFSALILLLGGLSVGIAQDGVVNDYTKKGKVISKASGAATIGEFEVTGYRLEVIDLDKPFKMGNGKPATKTSFRLILITKEDLPSGYYYIWIDSSLHTAGQIKPNEFAILMHGRTLPDQTLKLGFSRRGKTDLADRTTLGGTLSVPFEYATPLEKIAANNPIVRLRRVPPTNRII